MLAYQDPSHDGNSAKHHTGKPCVVKGCKAPAGTWWGPHWCHKHNVERMDRISANLEDFAKKAEWSAMVDKATVGWHDMVGKLIRENNALVLAAGGKATVTKAQLEFKPTSTGCSYHDDGSQTFSVY